MAKQAVLAVYLSQYIANKAWPWLKTVADLVLLKKACISYQHHVFFSINLEKATRNPDSERINAAKDIKG
jgi:hypothetical protein